ncbi:MAG TPA: SRPBCC family protein [Acidimicrobiia bacterium]|nr:SRPBCC family protein [Acidimicrobiia bacterium]
MKQGTRGEARVHIDAPPEKVYAVVSDVTRMGEWSPETKTCAWLDGATGPAVGARFKGTNKRGLFKWSTKPTVVAAEPGCEFTFEVNGTRWSYRFAAADGGTDAIESFEMLKDVPWLYVQAERLMGVKDRKADLEQAMQTTLERVKAAVEGT